MNKTPIILEDIIAQSHTLYAPSTLSKKRLSVNIGKDRSLEVEFLHFQDEGLFINFAVTNSYGNYQDIATL